MKYFQIPNTSEKDVTELSLADIIDAPAVLSMMEDLYRLTNIGCALVDLRGNVLVEVGWQDICMKFHRIHPETLKNCKRSATNLSKGVPFEQNKAYRCKNNLRDVSTPIVMNGIISMSGIFFLVSFSMKMKRSIKISFASRLVNTNLTKKNTYRRWNAYRVIGVKPLTRPCHCMPNLPG
jgi:ligand-binding sensor protein